MRFDSEMMELEPSGGGGCSGEDDMVFWFLFF